MLSAQKLISVFTLSFFLFDSCAMASHFAGFGDPNARYGDIYADQKPSYQKLVCFDGGGIRGLLELHIAKAVEDRMGPPGSLMENTDFLAGTSTGGIIALCLAKGLPLDQCIEFYKSKRLDIFPTGKSSWWRSFRNLFSETYSSEGLKRALMDTLGEDTAFSDLRKDVVITSYDIEGGKTKAPGTYNFNSKMVEFQSVKLWEAGLATSAAPTYFDPYYGIPGRSLVDGGIFANNPSEVAVSEFSLTYPFGDRDEFTASLCVLSFGTGMFHEPVSRSKSRDRGLLEWAGPISGVMMDAIADRTSRAMQTEFSDRYLRLNPSLPFDIPLDSVSDGTLNTLEDIARQYIQQNPQRIDAAAKLMRR